MILIKGRSKSSLSLSTKCIMINLCCQKRSTFSQLSTQEMVLITPMECGSKTAENLKSWNKMKKSFLKTQVSEMSWTWFVNFATWTKINTSRSCVTCTTKKLLQKAKQVKLSKNKSKKFKTCYLQSVKRNTNNWSKRSKIRTNWSKRWLMQHRARTYLIWKL